MGQLVVPGCDSAEVLDAPEHALDGVAVAIERGRETRFPEPVDLGRNVGCRPHGLDLAANGVAIIALVAVQDRCCGHFLQQGLGGGAVGHLAARQQERYGTAITIGQGMDLGGPPAAGAANVLPEFPPFPPEVQRCALTAEESISTCAGGPPAEVRA